jgi:dihydroorotase
MASVLAHTAAVFGRAILMPNLKPPIDTTAKALAYRERALATLPAGSTFQPLMVLYLTDATTPDEVRAAKAGGLVHPIKLYPAGATTNSDHDVSQLDRLDPTLAAMAEVGLPLLVHGEVTDPSVDIFDREAAFLDTIAEPLLERHPTLRMVVEHITTADAVAFVKAARPGVAATITPQHLLLNRNALFEGGVRPHHYCLPVLKREVHRQALIQAATSGDPRFFLGTDSAPHAKHTKEAACGCAGCFTAPHAMSLYATAFEDAGALDKLPDFASRFGPAFYGLPVNADTLTLVREPWTVPDAYTFGEDVVVPLWAGKTLGWRVA